MKKLLSLFMVATIATLAFAFTPKVNLTDAVYHLEGSTWEVGFGEGCTGEDDACQISFDDNYENYLNQITAQIPASGSFTAHIDTNNDQTPDADVPVTVLRFP